MSLSLNDQHLFGKRNPNITILDPLATCKTVFQGKESACIFFFNAVQWFALETVSQFSFPIGNIYAAQGSLCSVLIIWLLVPGDPEAYHSSLCKWNVVTLQYDKKLYEIQYIYIF